MYVHVHVHMYVGSSPSLVIRCVPTPHVKKCERGTAERAWSFDGGRWWMLLPSLCYSTIDAERGVRPSLRNLARGGGGKS